MEALMKKIVKYMVSERMILTEDRELYVYALQIVAEKVIGVITIGVISIVCNLFLQTLFFLLVFSQIRKYAGGFHLKHFYSCFISSVAMYVAWVKGIYPHLGVYTVMNLVMLLAAGIVVLIIGAVNNPEIAWSEQELEEKCKLTRYITAIIMAIITVFFCIRIDDSYLWFMSFGVWLSAGLVCIDWIRRRCMDNEKIG